MEFHEKLQTLRRQRGLTQEQLAEALYVSRTAVSKWESGRGLPGIESLKAIAAYFSVSVDTLLSGEELIGAAEQDGKRRERDVRDLVLGLLDCGAAVIPFLPLFAQRSGEVIRSVPMTALTDVSAFVRVIYFSAVLMLFAVYINSILYDGASNINFMYVASPPQAGLPFLTEEYGWLVYICHYAFTVVFCVTLCYIKPIVVAIKGKLSRKKIAV
jgi:transcriptional regulator with XRE-family HTH domain